MDYWDKLKNEIIDKGLCNRCGSCIGLSNGIILKNELGECLPNRGNKKKDIPQICYQACSGKNVDFPALNKFIFKKEYKDFLMGTANSFRVGYSNNPDIRRGAGSGGVVTSLLLHLLDEGLIDGAIVLSETKNKPYLAIPIIATSKKQILKAMQSKYSISPVNTILKDVENFDGTLAYVGLPCQVHSIRKLQQLGHPSTKKIKYIIGVYCGNILHFDAVKSFLKNNKVTDLNDIKSLKYRAGEWPGHLQVCLKNGEIFNLKKFYANYLIPFFMMKRCLLCTDLTNEFADIACGDAWAPVYEERGKGWSIVIGRTTIGEKILNDVTKKNILTLNKITHDDAVAMHSHSLEQKKVLNFIRINSRKHKPNYGYIPTHVFLKQKISRTLMDFIFAICMMSFSKKIIEFIPACWFGRIFDSARKRWKKMTKKHGKRDVSKTSFIITSREK